MAEPTVGASLTLVIWAETALYTVSVVPSSSSYETPTLTYLAASSSSSAYVELVAPDMAEQVEVVALVHRCHWYEKEDPVIPSSSFPDNGEAEAVSVCPSVVVPEIVGVPVFASLTLATAVLSIAVWDSWVLSWSVYCTTMRM